MLWEIELLIFFVQSSGLLWWVIQWIITKWCKYFESMSICPSSSCGSHLEQQLFCYRQKILLLSDEQFLVFIKLFPCFQILLLISGVFIFIQFPSGVIVNKNINITCLSLFIRCGILQIAKHAYLVVFNIDQSKLILNFWDWNFSLIVVFLFLLDLGLNSGFFHNVLLLC